MNFLRHGFFVIEALLVFTTCKNDLKLNAPYREIPSIYAVLSAQENVHMVRINKVFLGDADANVMAQVADSINYPADELTVTLSRYETGSNYLKQLDACPTCPADSKNKRVITFHDSVVTASPGSFNTTQRIYVSYDDLHVGYASTPSWSVSGDYVLTVKNNRTGNVFKAKSSIVDSVRLSNIFPLKAPFYPYTPGTDPALYVDYTEPEKTYNIYISPNESQVYQTNIRLHFYDSLQPYNILRYVDYMGNNMYLKDKTTTAFGTYIISNFKGKEVFSAAGIGIGKQGLNNEVFGRKLYKIEYFIYSSTQDYVDYLEFVKPSLNISQSKPLYSNFENRNALGIFTFRSKHSISKSVSRPFISEFSSNSNTCKYNFFTADLQLRGCP
ncbi:MAG: hypothetical protein IT236_02740 [Bacteroidia bacterium]|nr:hypothetical protein [Bacteroidia bacterium]